MEIKSHYQLYCQILSNAIKEAKRIYYDKKISKSSYNCKTTQDILKELSSKQHSQADIKGLMINSKHLKDKQDIADAFNNRLLSISDKTRINDVHNKINNKNLSTFHYYLEQNYAHPYLNILKVISY